MVQQYTTLTWLPSQPRQQQQLLTDTLGRHSLTSSWHLLGCRAGHYSPVFHLNTWMLPKTPHPLKHSLGKASCSYWRQAEDRTAASTEQRSSKTGGTLVAKESCSSHAEPPEWDKHWWLPPPPSDLSRETTHPMQEAKGLPYLGMSGGNYKERAFSLVVASSAVFPSKPFIHLTVLVSLMSQEEVDFTGTPLPPSCFWNPDKLGYIYIDLRQKIFHLFSKAIMSQRWRWTFCTEN